MVHIKSRGSRTEGRPELRVESGRVESRESMAAKDEIHIKRKCKKDETKRDERHTKGALIQ